MKISLYFRVIGFFLLLNACGGSTEQPVGSGTISESIEIVFDNDCDGGRTPVNNPFTMSVVGGKGFGMNKQGSITYVHSTQFHMEPSPYLITCDNYRPPSGFIIDAAGRRLTGYNVDDNGALVTSALVDVNFLSASAAAILPKPSTFLTAQVGLDANAGILTASGFDRNNPTTYHFETSVDLYDTLGNPHTLHIFYAKTGADIWSVFVVNDEISDWQPVPYVANLVQLHFDPTGALASSIPAMPVPFAFGVYTGAVSPLQITFDPTGTTQTKSGFSSIKLSQNGYSFGNFTGFSIATDGKITEHFSNGLKRLAAQIAL